MNFQKVNKFMNTRYITENIKSISKNVSDILKWNIYFRLFHIRHCIYFSPSFIRHLAAVSLRNFPREYNGIFVRNILSTSSNSETRKFYFTLSHYRKRIVQNHKIKCTCCKKDHIDFLSCFILFLKQFSSILFFSFDLYYV